MVWDMSIDRGATALAVFTRSRGAYAWPLPSGPVSTVYAVVAPRESEVDASPNDTIVHDFLFYNVIQPDTYNVAVSGNTWPTTLLTPSTLNMTASSTTTISVQVVTPNTINVDDSFTLTITSVTSPTLVYTATGITTAAVYLVITTSGDMSDSGHIGETITYTINVTNSGDYTDTFAVDVLMNIWTMTVSVPSVILGVGDSIVVEVYVEVGAGSSDMAHVTFTSALDNTVTAVVMLNTTSLGNISQDVYLPLIIRD